jgi:murein DD-endopeptidase MepM/ murein hydrolase activator NlpD
MKSIERGSSKIWPVPQAYSRKVSQVHDVTFGAPRQYKLGRGKHTGIDIHAPVGSKVLAIEDGLVVHVADFTGAPSSPQWRRTWYVMVEQADKRVAAYCELRKPRLKKGQKLKRGQTIGYIAKVLFGKTTEESAMLHFELHKPGSRMATDWIGKKPSRLLNPTNYLLFGKS